MERISDGKIKHMRGVAEYMAANARRFPDISPNDAYVVGFLHDIGYAYGKEGHERIGASMLYDNFEWADIIEFHGTTPQKYIEEMKFESEDEISNMLILLWMADLRVDSTGENVGYEKRLEGIGERYGTDSRAYRVCEEIINWLKERGY